MTSISSEYLAAVKWAEESYSPEEFVNCVKLPQVGKIMKGQILRNGIGVPSTLTPALNQTIFWLRLVNKCKVIGQCVKFKDMRGGNLPRAVTFGPRLEISDDYKGWFEILSEDGRSVRTIDSVAELAKRFPLKCLVRENVKCSLAKIDNEGQEFLSDKTRVLQVGEVLSLKTIGSFCTKAPSDKYLKCLTSTEEIIFMRLDQKGKFSPIAREDSISGVHSIRNISTKRLPLMTRLVHGSWPSDFKGFTPCIRIQSVVREPVLIGFPLLKDSSQLVELPLTSKHGIRLVSPQNTSLLTSLTQFSSLIEQGSRASLPVKEIQVLSPATTSLTYQSDAHQQQQLQHQQHNHQNSSQSHRKQERDSDSKARIEGDQRSDPHRRCMHVLSNSPLVMKCMTSHGMNASEDLVNQEGKENRPRSCGSRCSTSSSLCDSEYEEIDQIYDYIRGFAPLPDTVKRELKDSLWSPSHPPHPPHHHPHSYPVPVHPVPPAARFHQRYLIVDHRRLSYPSAGSRMSIGCKPVAPLPDVPVTAPLPDYEETQELSSRSSSGEDRLRNPANHADASASHSPQTPQQQEQANAQPPPPPPLSLMPKSKLFIKRSTTTAAPSKKGSGCVNSVLKSGKNIQPERNDCMGSTCCSPEQDHYAIITNGATNARPSLMTPIFNIRYKSMTNVSLSPPPPLPVVALINNSNNVQSCGCCCCCNSTGTRCSGTLDSSTSSSPKDQFRYPVSKTRKISKHRSLNNIFRDIASAFSFERITSDAANRKNSDGNLSSDRPTTLSSESLSFPGPTNYHNDNKNSKKDSLNNLAKEKLKVGTVYI